MCAPDSKPGTCTTFLSTDYCNSDCWPPVIRPLSSEDWARGGAFGNDGSNGFSLKAGYCTHRQAAMFQPKLQ